jgi:hypothetical protein
MKGADIEASCWSAASAANSEEAETKLRELCLQIERDQ